MRRSRQILVENTAHRWATERISRHWVDGCLSTGEGTGWQETIGAAVANSGYA